MASKLIDDTGDRAVGPDPNETSEEFESRLAALVERIRREGPRSYMWHRGSE